MHINERLLVNFWEHSGVGEPLGFPFYSTVLSIPRNPNACHPISELESFFFSSQVCVTVTDSEAAATSASLRPWDCHVSVPFPSPQSEKQTQGEGCSLAGRVICWHMQSPGFDSSTSQTGYRVLLASNSRPKEVDAGGSGVRGHPQLHIRFKAILNYRRRLLKNKAKQ